MNNFDSQLIRKYLPKEKWNEALEKLASGYPVQYIIGNVDFYGIEIDVNEHVLIPRFETEYLVDDLINYVLEYEFKNPKIIDIGTGSGCIAISLKKNINCCIDAYDISEEALEVAKKNAKKNNVQIIFLKEDISMLKINDNSYDIIVSNPPYVDFNIEVDEKTKYEPQNAIFAEDNGLYFYKIILEKSHDILKKRNIIAFEIGHNQADYIKKMSKEHYPNAKIIAKNDLNGLNRYIYIIND